MRYKVWDKQETLVTPIGEVLTADQVKAKFPMAALPNFEFIICDAPISMGVFMELEQTKSHYKNLGVEITEGMTGQEVCDAITQFEEIKPVPEPSAEERIAASLEFQNMLSLDSILSVENVLATVVDTNSDTSDVRLIKKNYKHGLWNKAMMKMAVGRMITAAQYTEITGEEYTR